MGAAALSRPITRILIFGGIAYAGAAITAVIINATGGLTASRVIIPGTPITVAAVLLPSAYMFSPALAHVLTRLITHQGWRDLGLRPRFDREDRLVWPVAWLLPSLLMLVGAVLYFAIFPGHFDPTFGAFREQLAAAGAASGRTVPMAPGLLLVAQIGSAIVVAPVINTVFAVGEEFGWRGYLQPQLMIITGRRRAMIITGVIWGVWHWPLILLGYEYGFGYPGAPWLGLLLFCVFTVAVGVFLGWTVIRGGSVWPAALAHGALNATAALPLLFQVGTPHQLLGPAPVGAIAMLGWVGCALVLLLRRPRRAV